MKDSTKQEVSIIQKSVGKCPKCGNYPTHFSGDPEKAYCWGDKKTPHKEWRKKVPKDVVDYGRY